MTTPSAEGPKLRAIQDAGPRDFPPIEAYDAGPTPMYVDDARLAMRVLDEARIDVERGDLHPAMVGGRVAEKLARIERATAPWEPQTLADRIRGMAPIGDRLTTGFPTLDDATRGGIPLGRLVVVLGAPGAAKTTLTTGWADQWERSGAVVGILAADEPADGIATRLGQLAGFCREDLEADGVAGDATRAACAAALDERRVIVLDGDDDRATLEGAANHLAASAGDRPRVLVVDSLQTVRCLAADAAESLRERITAVIDAAKRIARDGTLVVACSEMARSGYRGLGADTSTLATGKESGAIEYGASLIIGLRSAKGEVGLVDVDVAKNRIGPGKPEFRLRIDFARASMAEVPMPDKAQARELADGTKTREIRDELRKALAPNKGKLTSKRQITDVVKGFRGADVWRVLNRLEADGWITKGSSGRFCWVDNEEGDDDAS